MRVSTSKVLVGSLVVVFLAVVAVVGLRVLDRPPEPDPTAQAIAQALSNGTLSGVPVQGLQRSEVEEQLTAVLQGMDGLRPAVAVTGVQTGEDDNTATAALRMAWNLDDSDQDWTYTTTATLVLGEEDTWQLVWSPALLEPSLADGERLSTSTLTPPRAQILGADGAVLVTDRPVRRVGLDKTKVDPGQSASSADALASLLDVDRGAYAERVAAAGPKAFVEALVVRDDGTEDLDLDRVAAIPGAVALLDELPLAPTRTFARPLLGTVGQATAELVDGSAGRLKPGDSTGLSGLQRDYDTQLRGQAGRVVRVLPAADTGDAREVFRREPVPGQPLTTTLDMNRQSLAEELLAPVAPASAIVAIRPSTGEVLAAASGPGGDGFSSATLGKYAPGSTFKVVTALGLLRSGLTPDSVLACTPTATVDGRSFKNYGDYPAGGLGKIALRTVIANSCNTALISASDQLEQDALSGAAKALGLGGTYDPGVPAFTGSVPAQAGSTEHAASMIGQGRVEASPLAMATVAASIARGAPVSPRLVQGADVAPAGEGISAAEGEQLRALMRGVVTDGSANFLANLAGDPVGAKTGTAEYGTDQPPRTHAWMIAVQGDLAAAVFVADGASGSRTAGPLLAQFLRGTAG